MRTDVKIGPSSREGFVLITAGLDLVTQLFLPPPVTVTKSFTIFWRGSTDRAPLHRFLVSSIRADEHLGLLLSYVNFDVNFPPHRVDRISLLEEDAIGTYGEPDLARYELYSTDMVSSDPERAHVILWANIADQDELVQRRSNEIGSVENEIGLCTTPARFADRSTRMVLQDLMVETIVPVLDYETIDVLLAMTKDYLEGEAA